MSRRRPFIRMLLPIASVALAACDPNTRDTDIKRVAVGEAKALWDRSRQGQSDLVLFIDPRPLKYYDAAHIPGAEHLELPRFDRKDLKAARDPRLQRYANLVVYGDDPANPVAKGMTKRLLEFGYKGVRWFAGGMKEWNDRGYPTDGLVQAPAAPPSPPTAPAHPPPGGR